MSGQLLGAAEELPALSVVLALTDASGSRLTVEVDGRDGRTYLTVTFDGHEAPFELDRGKAVQVAGALRGLLNARRLGGDGGGVEAVGAVKHATAAVKQAQAEEREKADRLARRAQVETLRAKNAGHLRCVKCNTVTGIGWACRVCEARIEAAC